MRSAEKVFLNRLTISWAPVNENVNQLYRIEWSSNADFSNVHSSLVSADNFEYTIPEAQLAQGMWYFRVVAAGSQAVTDQNPSGDLVSAVASIEIKVQTDGLPMLDAPTNVSATLTGNLVRVIWDASTPAANIAGYTIQWRIHSDPWITNTNVSSTTTEIIVDIGNASGILEFRVRANAVPGYDYGHSPWSVVNDASSVIITHNTHEWHLVTSQGLQDYATWENIDGVMRLTEINAAGAGLTGHLDLSNCTELRIVYIGLGYNWQRLMCQIIWHYHGWMSVTIN
jgi:hypothetical protein